MTVRLSNLQYAMLRTSSERNSNFHMSIEQAQAYDQRPFRSMLIRQYIEFKPMRGFHLTQTGRKAANEFVALIVAVIIFCIASKLPNGVNESMVPSQAQQKKFQEMLRRERER